MQSCLAAVKTSVLVIQRCQETMGGSLRAELEDTLSRLLGCYTHILTDGTRQASKGHTLEEFDLVQY